MIIFKFLTSNYLSKVIIYFKNQYKTYKNDECGKVIKYYYQFEHIFKFYNIKIIILVEFDLCMLER